MQFAFDGVVVDTERYVIERDGAAVHVEPQVFDVLVYLLEHRDRVVRKEELLDAIWGDRFVSESALTSRIKSARQVVGDDGSTQAYIKTAHGRGYRWIAPVDITARPARSPHTAAPADAAPLIAPPTPLTSLVGRAHEIAHVRECLATHRLITVVGPPGVGKSRLAVEAVRTQPDRRRDVAFVDLRLAGAGHALALVQRAVGAGGATAGRDLRGTQLAGFDVDELAEHLRDRRLLLAVDNCEHLLDEVAALCRELLTRCPELAVIATSRRRLDVPGEVAVVLDPLTMPPEEPSWDELVASDAGRLFADRSVAAGARWRRSDDEAATIAALCRRLDGLPLAIELAAAKSRWLGLADLARHLDRELGHPDADAVTGALRMSRSLLDPHEARAFDALSVFAGSFTIDAAIAVVAAACPEHDALAVFGQLVEHSLVALVDDAPTRRYRLLETVQRYAEACRLATDDGGSAERAHAGHHLAFVRARWPAGRIATDTPWDVLGAEMDEITAAIERATVRDPCLARTLIGAVGWYWSIGGHAEQCEELADRASAGVDEDPADVAATFLWARANARLLLGRDPVGPATAAHAAAVAAGEWSVAAWALAHVIAPDMMWAELAVVEQHWDEVVDLFHRGDDPLGEAWAMVFVLGWAEACAQLPDRATETYERAAAIFQQHGDDAGLARALLEIVDLHTWGGSDPQIARAAFARIPELADTSLDFRMKYLWLGGLLAGADGDWLTAIEWHRQAVALGDRAVPGSIMASTYRGMLGWTLRWAGQPIEAASVTLRALTSLPPGRTSSRWAGHTTWLVESAGGLLSDVGDPGPAAQLMAAADRSRRVLDAPMPHWDRPRYEPDVRRARERLGDDAFESAWSAGQGLDLAAALRLARAELGRVISEA